METINTTTENVCGYTVHSYYIDGPESRKKILFTEKSRTCLRLFVFATLAPFAIIADTLVSIFH